MSASVSLCVLKPEQNRFEQNPSKIQSCWADWRLWANRGNLNMQFLMSPAAAYNALVYNDRGNNNKLNSAELHLRLCFFPAQ